MDKLKIWIQERKNPLITILLMLLIASICFGLGFILGKNYENTPIIIQTENK